MLTFIISDICYIHNNHLMETDTVQEKQGKRQLLDETGQNLEDSPQHQSSYEYVIKELNNIYNVIKKDSKIDRYLNRIELTANQIEESYKTIINSLTQLHAKSKESLVMKHSIGKSWGVLEDFLRYKSIDQLDSKEKTTWALEIQAKLSCSLEFLHSFKQHADITNSSKENYPKVWDRIQIVKCKDPEGLRKDYRKVKKLLHVAASAVLSELEHELKITKFFSFMTSFPQYIVMSEQAKLKSLKYYRTPQLSTAQLLWNMQQNGAIRQFSKVTYEGITTNRKIYIPPNGVINNKTDILTQNPSNITVRILYNKKIKIFSEGESMACCYKPEKQPKYIDTVILHMHGGGFIALSSRSMQIYTRNWANQLNIPIFSVDYRMPPEYAFPQAPYDCFVVYQFLLNYVHQFMNIRPKNIYLAGDSAGGNLALSLEGLILKHKLPNPRGIYVSYPATDLRLMFSQSRLHSINDVLLWPSTLLLCLTTYLQGDFKKGEDPLASPALLTEQYVNGTEGDKRFPLNWPKTIITVGSKDPLLDDSLIMMEKMTNSDVDCKLIVYEDLTHGYMNTAKIIDESKKAVDQSIDHLKQLIHHQSSVAKIGLSLKQAEVQQVQSSPQKLRVPEPVPEPAQPTKQVQLEAEIVEQRQTLLQSKGLQSTKDPEQPSKAEESRQRRKPEQQEGQTGSFKVTTPQMISHPRAAELAEQA